MKRLLALAYFFPPLGGGGCQRTLKLIRYLEPHQWAATVVTARETDYWIVDPTLAQEIPASAEVLRVRGLTSLRLIKLLSKSGIAIERPQGARNREVFRKLRRIQSWLLIPDGYRPWAREAQRIAARRIAAGGIHALWTTSSPESAHLAGLALKRRFDLPWVADFRDPWVGRATYRPPTNWHHERHRDLERRVVQSADRVTVVSEPMAALYRERYPSRADRVVVLPNGVDSDDWARSEALAPAIEEAVGEPRRFVLLHAGQLAHRPTARILLDAVRLVIEKDARAREEIRVRFLGGNEELLPGEWIGRGLDGVIEVLPSRPHLEALAAIRQAAALVLLGHGGSADALLYTGKIYEYATSGRPVLGIVDPGPGEELIRRSGIGEVCPARDAACVALVLEKWIAAWRRGEFPTPVPPAALSATWERERIAAEAAELLNGLLRQGG
jgi:glycosyltransferase involved in cell wall biosynthesis